MHIFILNLIGEEITTLRKYRKKNNKTVNGNIGEKKKQRNPPKNNNVRWLQIYVTLNPSHKQVFTWRPPCYSNDRSVPVMTQCQDWDSVDSRPPRVLWKNVQAVKLSLKRTVWGVVTSATASSCPSDRPSSAAAAAAQIKDTNTQQDCDYQQALGSRVWSKEQWSPFKVLQRFGLVRSSIDLTDCKINTSWLEEQKQGNTNIETRKYSLE